jgi:CheY-like chemotaxis protein
MARFMLLRVGWEYFVTKSALGSSSSAPDAILVVEDDDDTREALCRLLEGESYNVLDARNGLEALQVLTRTRPALIIMDLSMPVMNGWQLLERIRDKKLLPRLPVIVLSADDKLRDTDIHFMQKPVPAEILLQEIDALLCA